MVNQINERTKEDLINFSLKSLMQSREKLENIQLQLIELRSSNNSENNKNFVYKNQALSIERDTAERQLSLALDAYYQASIDAQHKSIYLERISQPNLPDYAIEPKRILNIFATILICLMCYGILKLIIASIYEHQD
jgi:capsular polysaccharide transport system permease protein